MEPRKWGTRDDGFINKGTEMVNLDTETRIVQRLGSCRLYRAHWRCFELWSCVDEENKKEEKARIESVFT